MKDDTFTFTLDYPLTDEQWDMIQDVDLERTDNVWFHTKHNKEVEFVKVIRCKDCKHWYCYGDESFCSELGIADTNKDSYCSYAKRKEK